jgi:FADH2 O2-dependent halogenase
MYDAIVLGGGLMGSMAAVMLRRRGMTVLVLEARPIDREMKVVVGEAITEGTSVFLRHEIGLTDWLKANVFRKFGFDFLTLPRDGRPVTRLEDCHELLLSTSPLEKIPSALSRLIPTYHVERTGMNRHVAELAKQQGATYLHGALVEHVELGPPHTVHYVMDGAQQTASARWVLDCSGRRTLLGRQLGITRPKPELNTASVWNRFENVCSDPSVWRTFHGVDRRRHTIHMTGHGFWIWWIHQSPKMTSVGISYDRDVHEPNVKTDDRGFWEMMRKFPPVIPLLEGARPLEPFQYYAHLPYQSDHWLSERGYALIGDAAWFTDALYSIGIETACRQLINLMPVLADPCPKKIALLNTQFARTQASVLHLNHFKYKEAWHRPHTLMQTALYELGEIAELYYLQRKESWTPEMLAKYYRLQWHCPKGARRLREFLADSLPDADRDLEPNARLLKRALLPGSIVYGATWPLWNTPGALPYFFKLIRGWAHSERWAQRSRLWPDALGMMASAAPTLTARARALFGGRAEVKEIPHPVRTAV